MRRNLRLSRSNLVQPDMVIHTTSPPLTHKLTAGGWRASLALALRRRAERTALTHVCHRGPLRVQRPFYPEGDEVAHVYLLHPPGGVVGGDRLEIDIDIGTQAHALFTTPGATKFYRSGGELAAVEQSIRVIRQGIVEWVPQETIFFSGAKVQSRTRIDLESDALFIGWDIQCFGRPEAGEAFDAGDVVARFEIWREQRPLFLECARVSGKSAFLEQAWGLGKRPVSATFWCTDEHAPSVAQLRDVCHSGEMNLFSVTQLPGVIVCRLLSHRVEDAKRVFLRAWDLLRPRVLNRSACCPRIWAT